MALWTGGAALSAQQKPTLTPADYGRWESLGAATLSPDGGWLSYAVRRVDEQDELRIRALDEDSARVVPFGSDAAFSADGRWLAYLIGLSPEQRDDHDARERAGLLDLRTRRDTTFEGVDGLRLQRGRRVPRALPAAAGRGGARWGRGGAGAGTGEEIPLGNVDDFVWSPSGHLLALTVRTASGAGGGVQLYDPVGGYAARSGPLGRASTTCSPGGRTTTTWR